MTLFTVCTKKAYTKKGATKESVYWNQVGTLRLTDDGKYYLELHMFPGTSFYVFPPKAKEESDAFNG